jgi:alkylation response protein AidB-like acyl-CoA dehydrogenase
MRNPTPLDIANSVASLVESEAAEAERIGRLTEPVAATLLDNKLFSILVGERFHGWGGTFSDMFHAAERVAQADGSAGWCVSACNAVNYTAYQGLSSDGRVEVFGNGPVACWTSFLPIAKSEPVSGGFKVSGRWNYGSGSSLSKWVLVTSMLGGSGDDQMYRAHLIPREQVKIIEGSWDVMGLSATASIDYEIIDAFVPEYLAFEFPSNCTSLPYRVSVRDGGRANVIGLTAVLSGLATASLENFIETAADTKRLTSQGGLADDRLVQVGVAQLGGRLEAARNNLLKRVNELDEQRAFGSIPSDALGSEVTLCCHLLAEAAKDTTLFVFWHSSSGSVYKSNPLQRRLRDTIVALKHAAFTPGNLARIGAFKMHGELGSTVV